MLKQHDVDYNPTLNLIRDANGDILSRDPEHYKFWTLKLEDGTETRTHSDHLVYPVVPWDWTESIKPVLSFLRTTDLLLCSFSDGEYHEDDRSPEEILIEHYNIDLEELGRMYINEII